MRYILTGQLESYEACSIGTGGRFKTTNGVMSGCNALLRSMYIDLSRHINTESLYYGCVNLTLNNIPISDDGKLYLATNTIAQDEYNPDYITAGFSSVFGVLTIEKLPDIVLPNIDKIRYCELQGFIQFSSIKKFPKIINGQCISNIDRFCYNCLSLTDVSEVENIDFSNVTSADRAFCGCTSITSLPVLHLPRAKNLEYMYWGCMLEFPEGTVFAFANYIDAPLASYAKYLFANNFQNSVNMIIDMRNALPSLIDASNMFYDTRGITEIRNYDFTNVRIMNAFVSLDSSLKRIDNPHTMGNVVIFSAAFYGTNLDNPITLGDPDPTHKLDISHAENISQLFSNVTFGSPFIDWDLTIPESCTNSRSAFSHSNCSKATLDFKGNSDTEYMLNQIGNTSDITLTVKLKFNRSISYSVLNNLLASSNPNAELSLSIMNIGALTQTDFNSTIDFTSFYEFRTFALAGYVDKDLLPFFSGKYTLAQKIVNCNILKGTTIKRGVVLFDFTRTPGNVANILDIILNPLRWDDTKEYLQPEEYKTLFNWGSTDFVFEVINIYLHDPDNNWKESYWQTIPQENTGTVETTLFGYPTSEKKPKTSFVNYRDNFDFPFPDSWIE